MILFVYKVKTVEICRYTTFLFNIFLQILTKNLVIPTIWLRSFYFYDKYLIIEID